MPILPSERPIRDLMLKRLQVDPETYDSLDERDYFSTALNRYVQRRFRERDMYRETLDDLVDASFGDKPFSRFPPKDRHEGKYYTDYWRNGIVRPSRMFLYRLRTSVLWELSACGLVCMPHWPWQRITVVNPQKLKRLQTFIAEFEDRCLMDIHGIESRIEYDEIQYKLIEHSPKGEAKVLREMKSGKMPEKLFQCLFAHDGLELTVDKLYERMGVDKKGRRVARWRDEVGLDEPDIAKYFHWKDKKTFVFSAKRYQSNGKDMSLQYPFAKPKLSKIDHIIGGIWFRSMLVCMGTPLKVNFDDLPKRPIRGFFSGLMPACIRRRPHRPL